MFRFHIPINAQSRARVPAPHILGLRDPQGIADPARCGFSPFALQYPHTLFRMMHLAFACVLIITTLFMPSTRTKLRRKIKAASRTVRGVGKILGALASTDHPLLAHIIPMRRCNLACKYCNEFDDVSKPVALEIMFERLDKLAELKTSVITISGGEPLLHPELDDIIRRIRGNGMVAGMITNGYLIVPERIKRLNDAGLEWLQISIDNVNPDDVSKKSLKVLDKKLEILAEHADFHVNIN